MMMTIISCYILAVYRSFAFHQMIFVQLMKCTKLFKYINFKFIIAILFTIFNCFVNIFYLLTGSNGSNK